MNEPPVWASFTKKLDAAIEDAAADRSEADTREAMLKVTFSEMVNAIGGSVAKAEHEARGSERYRQLTEALCAARTRAAMSAAKVKGMEHMLDAWRTAESSRRATVKLK